ncbi:MAG: hypothetical protein PHU47_00390 [Candidatus ainarchaeum sp.]|nr:hypothetical protein [Candidatus ainarchaeum sp.]
MTQNNDNSITKDQESLLIKKQFLEQLLGQETIKEVGLDDLIKVQEKFNDPMLLSVLIYKLIEEKKQTNELLRNINEKYDKLQFMLQQKNQSENSSLLSIPSETDDKIISYIRSVGKADAETIKTEFKYKGTNAASQRLNNLVKVGHLSKIVSGRKVYFIVK